MQILLVSIINSYKYGNTGVDFIAHSIREKHIDTVDIKYYHNKECYDDIIRDIPLNYDIYGFSIFETNFLLSNKISTFIKNNHDNAIIVFGGQFVTMNYMEMVNDCGNVDYFIIGDGESPISKIINHHRSQNTLLIDDNNIVSANNIFDKTINIEDHTEMDTCYDYYLSDNYERNCQKTHCMMTKSNICTGACTFCCSRKGRVKYKDTEKIVNEIKYLATKYGVRKFFFCEDDIFDIDCDENRFRLNDLFNKILDLDLNIVFSGFSKAKAICNPNNYELLKKMNLVGFHHLFLGIDAGNESDRVLYNKRSSLYEGMAAVRILNEVNISPRYGMIFINPYSSIQTMRESYRYLLELKSSNFYHYGGLHVQLLNGTRLLEKVRNDGLLKENFSFKNVEAYNFLHPEIIPVVNFLKNEFIPKADEVRHQFNTLKRKFELVRHLNKQAEQYCSFVSHYEEIEYEAIKQLLYPLFEENNVNACRNQLDRFINSMEMNALEYAPVIRELNNLFISTPIKK